MVWWIFPLADKLMIVQFYNVQMYTLSLFLLPEIKQKLQKSKNTLL